MKTIVDFLNKNKLTSLIVLALLLSVFLVGSLFFNKAKNNFADSNSNTGPIDLISTTTPIEELLGVLAPKTENSILDKKEYKVVCLSDGEISAKLKNGNFVCPECLKSDEQYDEASVKYINDYLKKHPHATTGDYEDYIQANLEANSCNETLYNNEVNNVMQNIEQYKAGQDTLSVDKNSARQ